MTKLRASATSPLAAEDGIEQGLGLGRGAGDARGARLLAATKSQLTAGVGAELPGSSCGRLLNRFAADQAALAHRRDKISSGLGSARAIFSRLPIWERRKFLTGGGGPPGWSR